MSRFDDEEDARHKNPRAEGRGEAGKAYRLEKAPEVEPQGSPGGMPFDFERNPAEPCPKCMIAQREIEEARRLHSILHDAATGGGCTHTLLKHEHACAVDAINVLRAKPGILADLTAEELMQISGWFRALGLRDWEDENQLRMHPRSITLAERFEQAAKERGK